jgi:hypothetical protein
MQIKKMKIFLALIFAVLAAAASGQNSAQDKEVAWVEKRISQLRAEGLTMQVALGYAVKEAVDSHGGPLDTRLKGIEETAKLYSRTSDSKVDEAKRQLEVLNAQAEETSRYFQEQKDLIARWRAKVLEDTAPAIKAYEAIRPEYERLKKEAADAHAALKAAEDKAKGSKQP